MKFNAHLWVQRMLAYTFGDLDAAMDLFQRDVADAMSDGKSEGEAVKAARRKSARGVSDAGISASLILFFCAIDARWIAPRWPGASMAWFALAFACALVFVWRYYGVAGAHGWRRAWYRFTGDPRIDDFDVRHAIDPLGRMLWRRKAVVRLAGAAGAILLPSAMVLMRFASLAWADPWTWVTAVAGATTVYWPVIYLDAINRAYHHMCVACMLSGD